jgi:hypothetical protein
MKEPNLISRNQTPMAPHTITLLTEVFQTIIIPQEDWMFYLHIQTASGLLHIQINVAMNEHVAF